jgi:hypothetical protein
MKGFGYQIRTDVSAIQFEQNGTAGSQIIKGSSSGCKEYR